MVCIALYSIFFDLTFNWFVLLVSQKVSDPNSVEFQNETSLCEDPELVLKFLNTDFIKDSLAEYFVSPSDTLKEEENKPGTNGTEKRGIQSMTND